MTVDQRKKTDISCHLLLCSFFSCTFGISTVKKKKKLYAANAEDRKERVYEKKWVHGLYHWKLECRKIKKRKRKGNKTSRETILV